MKTKFQKISDLLIDAHLAECGDRLLAINHAMVSVQEILNLLATQQVDPNIIELYQDVIANLYRERSSVKK